jgi:hypothetical protein
VRLSLEQFRERLVDYLYGTLEGDERKAFEECLAESEVCRRELSTLQSTLRTVRLELAKPQDEPPPSVRASVLAAAAVEARVLEAAARERKSQRPSARPSSRPARPVPDSARGGLWSWLRAPWLLPTLGVAAAVAVVVLHKEVESPVQREAESREPAGPSAASPAESVAPAKPAAPEAVAPAPAQGMAEGRAPEPSAAPGKGYAAPPPAWDESRRGSAAASKKAAATPTRARDQEPGAEEKEASGRLEPMADELAAAPATSEPRGGGAAGLGAARSGERPRVESAARHRAPAASSASAPSADRATQSADEAAQSADKAAPSAESTPGSNMHAPAADDSAESTLLAKLASAHMKARRWRLAGDTYRELLARFPRDPRVAGWQKQLTLAERAAVAEASDAGR